MAFWLYDSRHRGNAKHAKRILRIYAEFPRGRIALWQHVLRSEVQSHEWDAYEGFYDPADYDEFPDINDYHREWARQSVEVFNDYWGCYGWWLCCAPDNEPLPDDCELRE